MNKVLKLVAAVLLIAGMAATPAFAQQKTIKSVKENTKQVQILNTFADDVADTAAEDIKTAPLNNTHATETNAQRWIFRTMNLSIDRMTDKKNRRVRRDKFWEDTRPLKNGFLCSQ